MEEEVQRLVRAVLREPAVHEAAAEAVGSVSYRTAAAALQAVLPARWGGGGGGKSARPAQ